MKRNAIYVVDENAPARRANTEALKRLLDAPELEFYEGEPFPSVADYNAILAAPNTAAFVLDQRMKQAGLVSYNGTDLAAHLRQIDPKMPIYILTGYNEEIEDFDGCEHLVEYIIGKSQIRDRESKEAKIIKARMLRHLNVFNDVRDAQGERFHELLVKSLHGALTQEEHAEMDKLEGVISAPVAAAERAEARSLGEVLDELKKLTGEIPI